MTLSTADRLTGQLYHLPSIVGKLGISIANAQKALNADYLENIRQLLVMIDGILKDDGKTTQSGAQSDDGTRQAAMMELLRALAPSRYQFTETSIDFSADLSETLSVAAAGGLGGGFGAVVFNASLAVGFGRDYRAAARVKSILHAIPADKSMMEPLLGRARDMDAIRMTLPQRTEIDAATYNQLADVREALGGSAVPRLPAEDTNAAGQRIVRQESQKATADAQNAIELAAKFKDPNNKDPKDVLKQQAVAARESARAHLLAAQAALKDIKEAERETSQKLVDAAKARVDDAAKAVDEIDHKDQSNTPPSPPAPPAGPLPSRRP
jgi:hypothetical protein